MKETKKDLRKCFYLHLKAKNNTNGNPQRLFVVIDAETGDAIDAIDEGYRGDQVKDIYPNAKPSVAIDLKQGEYRYWLREEMLENLHSIRDEESK